ncbi:MAG: hypothetical protein ABI459_03605, partial [Deltaproteobacteria bacterium]
MPGLTLEQSNEMLRWLAWLWLAGFLARPLAVRLLPGQSDDGYISGKLLGWLLMMFIPWTGSALGLVSFHQSGPLVGVIGLGLIYAMFRSDTAPLNVRKMLWFEGLFALLFILGLTQRLAEPNLI